MLLGVFKPVSRSKNLTCDEVLPIAWAACHQIANVRPNIAEMLPQVEPSSQVTPDAIDGDVKGRTERMHCKLDPSR